MRALRGNIGTMLCWFCGLTTVGLVLGGLSNNSENSTTNLLWLGLTCAFAGLTALGYNMMMRD
ncbi:MAG: hypothetical protein JWM64_2079 [Frankiales bacterium]|nr:hypothetical protein [Frankiales bacterium]